MKSTEHNPWKTGVIATGGALLVLVAGGFAVAAFNPSQTTATAPQAAVSPPAEPATAQVAAVQAPAQPATAPAPAAAAAATPAPREDCRAYLSNAASDSKRIVKDGALGALVGAGTGAAGGAIADGGSGAGKGAGIGAVVGAVAGAFHGVTRENEKVDQAERAYHNCLARNG